MHSDQKASKPSRSPLMVPAPCLVVLTVLTDPEHLFAFLGIVLGRKLPQLVKNGLNIVNISLDTLGWPFQCPAAVQSHKIALFIFFAFCV